MFVLGLQWRGSAGLCAVTQAGESESLWRQCQITARGSEDMNWLAQLQSVPLLQAIPYRNESLDG